MPRVMIGHSVHPLFQDGGFTLIEVLVAMFLLMVGLLGVAQLHFSSFQENRNALYRNQATVIAEDLIDRARGNPVALRNGRYNNLSFNSASSTPASVSCIAVAGCNAEEQATKDVREWARNFVTALPDFIAGLPDAVGTGDADAVDAAGVCPGTLKYDVTVSWRQPDGTRGVVNMSACL